ncbi:MAG: hypothetical protein IT383_07350 [Deltaproteobacteria bacterium]|nr:hypothetical protein [Deltaproteobacteria bacterium]
MLRLNRPALHPANAVPILLVRRTLLALTSSASRSRHATTARTPDRVPADEARRDTTCPHAYSRAWRRAMARESREVWARRVARWVTDQRRNPSAMPPNWGATGPSTRSRRSRRRQQRQVRRRRRLIRWRERLHHRVLSARHAARVGWLFLTVDTHTSLPLPPRGHGFSGAIRCSTLVRMFASWVLTSSLVVTMDVAVPVGERVAELGAALDAAKANGSDSRALRELPDFVQVREGAHGAASLLLQAGAGLDAATRAALVEYLGRRNQPRSTALALMWLASDRDARDLAIVKRHLERREQAGSLPIVLYGQVKQAGYPMRWIDVTVHDVALAALGLITGQRFASSEQYRDWVRSHPDIESSYDYWLGFLSDSSPEQRKSKLDGLRARNAELFLKVVLTDIEQHRHFGWAPDDVVAVFASTISPQRALAMVRRWNGWPELADDARALELGRWILQHHARTLGNACDELTALWRHRSTLEIEMRSWLAKAVAECRPAESRSVLVASLDEMPTPQVVAELVRRHLDVEEDRVARTFFGAGESSSLQRAILVELRAMGPRGKQVLARLVLDERLSPDDPFVIAEMVDTALALGAPNEFPLRSEIFGRAKRPASEQQEAAARADHARRACLARVRRWLGG